MKRRGFYKRKQSRELLKKFAPDYYIQPRASRIQTDPCYDDPFMYLKTHKKLQCYLKEKPRSWKHYRKSQYKIK